MFSRQNRVLYVEPRLAVRGLARRLRSGEIKLRHFIGPRLQQVRDNIFVYRDPIHFPRTAWRVVGPAIERRRDALLARAFRRLGVSRPILWLVRPDCWDLPGKFDEKAIIYQVVDDYLSYPGVTERARVRLDGQERAIGSRANLVIATSEHLVKLKRHLSSNILHVRNGVDAHTLEEGKKTGGRTPVCLTDASRRSRLRSARDGRGPSRDGRWLPGACRSYQCAAGGAVESGRALARVAGCDLYGQETRRGDPGLRACLRCGPHSLQDG